MNDSVKNVSEVWADKTAAGVWKYTIDLVCFAVESLCGLTRIKERMNFDSNFSYLLLDKRLSFDGRFDEHYNISTQ